MKKGQRQFLNTYKWWDQTFLLKAIEDWCQHASHCHKTKGNLVRAEDTSKQLAIVAQLAKRLRQDEVYTVECRVFSSWNDNFSGTLCEDFEIEPFSALKTEKANKAKQRDLEYLTDMMKKHLFTWWD